MSENKSYQDMQQLQRLMAGSSDGPIGGTPSVSDSLETLVKRVWVLEQESDELGRIRATLLLNFGERGHGRYGITIGEEPSAIAMMLKVLEHLVKERSA